MSEHPLRDLVVEGGGLAGIFGLGWAFIKERVKRADTQLDAANARGDAAEARAAAAEARAAAAEAEARQFKRLWQREARLVVEAALSPAPAHVPDSLPPPNWDETTDIRDMREAIRSEALAHAKAQVGDRSLLAIDVTVEPSREPLGPRPKQVSRPAIELDQRSAVHKPRPR